MALTRPILASVPAWDVADGYTFTFTVSGGDQPTGSTIYIFDNATGTQVYTQSVTSFANSITVPANAAGLTNGTYYYAYVQTTASGETSSSSNSVQFYCYSTPVWGFSNIVDGGTVDNSTFVPAVSYVQTEQEPLGAYNILLYDSSQNLLTSSGVTYVSSEYAPLSLTYTFTNLNDSTVYYVRATGTTANNTQLDTGYIRFTVTYVSPSTYSQFYLTNNCDEGYITYSSNISAIDGEAGSGNPIYIDDDSVDLRNDYVSWTDGFSVSGNFTLKAWITNPNLNSTLLTLSGDEGDIVIGIYEDENSSQVYAQLVAGGSYFIYTDAIAAPASTDQLCIQVRRINNIYDIFMEVVF